LPTTTHLSLLIISELNRWQDLRPTEAISHSLNYYMQSVNRLGAAKHKHEEASAMFKHAVKQLLDMVTHYQHTGQVSAVESLCNALDSSKRPSNLCLTWLNIASSSGPLRDDGTESLLMFLFVSWLVQEPLYQSGLDLCICYLDLRLHHH
jgi:hypothetical protein